jgi:hypothetical protein
MDCQHIMARFEALKRRIFRPQPEPSIMQRMPREILDVIFDFLSTQDQICLALSCKFLYTCFLTRFKVSDLRPFVLRATRPLMTTNKYLRSKDRVQILSRLDDSRWKYCKGCCNLHPRSAWRPPPSPSVSESLQQQLCMPYAGMVDICPCLSITFPEKQHLMGTINIALSNTDHRYESFFNDLLHYPDEGRRRGCFGHHCHLYKHPVASVDVSTIIYLDKETKNLRVRNEYRFAITRADADKTRDRDSGIVWKCPHENTQDWLQLHWLA